MDTISMTAIQNRSNDEDVVVFFGDKAAEHKSTSGGFKLPESNYLERCNASVFRFDLPDWRPYFDMIGANAPEIVVFRKSEIIFRKTLIYYYSSDTRQSWYSNDDLAANRRVVWAALDYAAAFLAANPRDSMREHVSAEPALAPLTRPPARRIMGIRSLDTVVQTFRKR